MKKAMLLFWLFVIALLEGCGRDYPQSTRDTFMDNCTYSSSRAYCKCALEGIEDQYTLEQFVHIEQELAGGVPIPTKMFEITQVCRAKHGQ